MSPHRVCLLGFSDFERRALALQFRLAVARQPAYELVATHPEAQFLVVDGDARPAVQRALDSGRLADCLFVGAASAPSGALACLRRPIDALSLMRELDAAVMRLRAGDGSPEASPSTRPPAKTPPVATPTLRVVATPVSGAPDPAAAAADSPLAALVARFPDRASAGDPPTATDAASPATPATAASRCDALLVDDSEIALRFLEIKLGELGLRSRTVTDSDAALEQLQQHDFNYVFLDVELGPASKLDGLALCRHIKRRSSRPPVVAMVSAHASQTDRVRGSLAGCDAYLGKPLQASELLAVVGLRRAR
jgi:CheY-like chemotaxis protein